MCSVSVLVLGLSSHINDTHFVTVYIGKYSHPHSIEAGDNANVSSSLAAPCKEIF